MFDMPQFLLSTFCVTVMVNPYGYCSFDDSFIPIIM